MSYENQSGKLLTTNDAKTLLGLFALWSDQGFGDWVTFTEFQLLRKLNMDTGGRQYEMLRDSLNKLRETSLVLHEAYDKEKGTRFVTERFQLSLLIALFLMLQIQAIQSVDNLKFNFPHIFTNQLT